MASDINQLREWLEADEEQVAAERTQKELQELARYERTPCDGCSRASRCAAEELACSAFEQFAVGRNWSVAPRVDPTHERWDSLFRPRR